MSGTRKYGGGADFNSLSFNALTPEEKTTFAEHKSKEVVRLRQELSITARESAYWRLYSEKLRAILLEHDIDHPKP